MTPFKAVLVSLAYIELLLWKRFDKPKVGAYTESDPQVRDRLKAYYAAMGYSGKDLDAIAKQAANDEIAWSAAFISYLFHSAGAGRDFPVALAHSKYVTALKDNVGRDPKMFPFQAWPLGVLPPEVGDVICVWRDADEKKAGIQQPKIHGKKVSWGAIQPNNWQHFSSHCDLIVKIDGHTITAIGGNVGNRVAESKYTTNVLGLVSHPRGIALIKNFR